MERSPPAHSRGAGPDPRCVFPRLFWLRAPALPSFTAAGAMGRWGGGARAPHSATPGTARPGPALPGTISVGRLRFPLRTALANSGGRFHSLPLLLLF